MCRFASFVITKGFKAFWSKTEDSHSEIRREHGLPENGIGGITSVQVEYTPEEDKAPSIDQLKWNFRVDQDKLPDWWNEADAKSACWTALSEMCKARGIDLDDGIKRRIRIPDGYERCPKDHLLRRDIDLCPMSYTHSRVAFRSTDQKKAYKSFQWVKGWDGLSVDSLVNRSGLMHTIFIRPKAK